MGFLRFFGSPPADFTEGNLRTSGLNSPLFVRASAFLTTRARCCSLRAPTWGSCRHPAEATLWSMLRPTGLSGSLTFRGARFLWPIEMRVSGMRRSPPDVSKTRHFHGHSRHNVCCPKAMVVLLLIGCFPLLCGFLLLAVHILVERFLSPQNRGCQHRSRVPPLMSSDLLRVLPSTR